MVWPRMEAPGNMSNVVPLRKHETAVIHPGARIGRDVEIGPYVVIGDGVTIGDGCSIGAHVQISGYTEIGRNVKIFQAASIGCDPQDLKYKGEKSYLFIGDNTIIREFTTLSRGTEGGGGETRIGADCLIMANAHVAHDCQVGNGVILVNSVALGGHVTVEDRAVVGGLSGVHQFCKIGRMAMIGACSKVVKDVPPYVMIDGNPAKVAGINITGLRRNNVPSNVRDEIRKAYKVLYRSNLNTSQAIEVLEQTLVASPEIEHFIGFLKGAERGIVR